MLLLYVRIHFSLIYDSFVKRCACVLYMFAIIIRARAYYNSLCDCCPWTTTVHLSSLESSIKMCLPEVTKRNAKHEFVLLCLNSY